MSYQIGKVTYTDFGPFESVALDFNVPGLTVVEGVIENMPGCSSNGAGKSMIFDGPVWAIWGRCIREKYKGDDLIRIGAKWCSVKVELIGGPQLLTVTRYRKHPKFEDQLQVRLGCAVVVEYPTSLGNV